MPVVVIANPKGGAGKSTLSTNVAGYFASRGYSVMLGDADKQQSSRLWLGIRPPVARRIGTWDIGTDNIAKPPKGTTHVVIDTPAGLHGKRLKEVVRRADKILIPVQASVFDLFATRSFLDELRRVYDADRTRVAMVGMRLDSRTIASDKLFEFAEGSGIPMPGYLRDTQNYVHLSAQGLTVFDVAPGRVERDLELWEPLCKWLDDR